MNSPLCFSQCFWWVSFSFFPPCKFLQTPEGLFLLGEGKLTSHREGCSFSNSPVSFTSGSPPFTWGRKRGNGRRNYKCSRRTQVSWFSLQLIFNLFAYLLQDLIFFPFATCETIARRGACLSALSFLSWLFVLVLVTHATTKHPLAFPNFHTLKQFRWNALENGERNSPVWDGFFSVPCANPRCSRAGKVLSDDEPPIGWLEFLLS